MVNIYATSNNCIWECSERSDLLIERFYVLKNRVKNDRSTRIQSSNAAIVTPLQRHVSLSIMWYGNVILLTGGSTKGRMGRNFLGEICQHSHDFWTLLSYLLDFFVNSPEFFRHHQPGIYIEEPCISVSVTALVYQEPNQTTARYLGLEDRKVL